jgi:LuxR family maltose regulon positive regulatory protein
MATPILSTKLYIPPAPPRVVVRPRLIEQLNEGLSHKLTLISAPAGFGKTTLVSEWLASCSRPAAWLSLDAGENDLARFFTHLIMALQTLKPTFGALVLELLQSPQPPSIEAMLTALLNDVTPLTEAFLLVLDDYHLIEAQLIDQALTFLLEHQPPQMHLVIATREDPHLPLARLRARGHLRELRAADLRFTLSESAEFLNQGMRLTLSADEIAALDTRTEGWIAGLQLAALSLQGQREATSFIASFTGSHQFVMDYLLEEVLQRQPERIQTFLLRTSVLDSMCGSLCDAVVDDLLIPGQATLEYLVHANLFVVPLDNERRWYRYHHLFADLLRQRLSQNLVASPNGEAKGIADLHLRASQWYETQGFDLEAFRHAAAANDVERALRLMQGKGIPRHFRGAMTAILDWLASLPQSELDARPWLLVRYASGLLVIGQTTGVEEKLQAAEATLEDAEPDEQTRDLIGQIAAARATLAFGQNHAESMLAQSRRALEFLSQTNLPYRMTAYWTLGNACQLQGDRAAARQAYSDVIALGRSAGDVFYTLLGTLGLGAIQIAENQLYLAAETYREALRLAGEMPQPIVYEAHLGLARVLYEWNDLEGAELHGRQGLHLAQQYERGIDRFILCEVFLARLKLAQDDVAGAAAQLAQTTRVARQRDFVDRLPEVAAAQILTLLRQSHLAAAADLAQRYNLPLSLARVHLAQGDPSAALATLEPWRRQVEAKELRDETLRAMVLQAMALQANGDDDRAVQALWDALEVAEPGGFIRLFIDEGPPMARLLSAAISLGKTPNYVEELLAAFSAETRQRKETPHRQSASSARPLIEPLSHRELEVLHLIAQGLSNQEISERLVLALSTVKGHNLKIFAKLQVQRRTEAVARARELGLL